MDGCSAVSAKDDQLQKKRKKKSHRKSHRKSSRHRKRSQQKDSYDSKDSESKEKSANPVYIASDVNFSDIFRQATATIGKHPEIKFKGKKRKSREKNYSVVGVFEGDLKESSFDSALQRSNGLDCQSSFPSTSKSVSKDIPHTVTSLHLAIADLETDTELDLPDPISIAPPGPQAAVEVYVVSSSESDSMRAVPVKKKRKYKRKAAVQQEPHIVILSSSSSTPPTPERDVVELDYNRSQLQPSSLIDPNMHNMRIRIQYRCDLIEFNGSRLWDVETVRERLSERIDIRDTEILLYTESGEKMVDGKTLEFYNVNSGDILEALRCKSESPSAEVNSLGAISLKFQKEGLKRPLMLLVNKFASLKEIRSRVASSLKLDEKQLLFRIDGEIANLTQTPDDLDLEDDCCVDVYQKS